jgi:hypothetical protein
MEASDPIRALSEESRRVHLEMLDVILQIALRRQANRAFSADDLRQIGVDPTPPDPKDYPNPFDGG